MFVDVDTRAAMQSKPATIVYNYKKADWQAMREDMENLRLPEDNMQQQWGSLEDKLHQMLNDHVPSWKAKSTRQKPWTMKKVKETLNMRDRAHTSGRRVMLRKTKPNTPLSIPEPKPMSVKLRKSILRAS